MSVIDDGVLTWNYQGYWTTNAGYGPAWLELLQNLNQRCDFMGEDRPTVPLMQPDPDVDPVTWVGLCSSAATPGYVFDMITAMQASLNTLETNAAWCDDDGTEYSGFDLTALDGHNRTKLLAIIQHMIMSLDAHRYMLLDEEGPWPFSVTPTYGSLKYIIYGESEISWDDAYADIHGFQGWSSWMLSVGSWGYILHFRTYDNIYTGNQFWNINGLITQIIARVQADSMPLGATGSLQFEIGVTIDGGWLASEYWLSPNLEIGDITIDASLGAASGYTFGTITVAGSMQEVAPGINRFVATIPMTVPVADPFDETAIAELTDYWVGVSIIRIRLISSEIQP